MCVHVCVCIHNYVQGRTWRISDSTDFVNAKRNKNRNHQLARWLSFLFSVLHELGGRMSMSRTKENVATFSVSVFQTKQYHVGCQTARKLHNEMKDVNAFKSSQRSPQYCPVIQSTNQTFFMLEAAGYLQWL